MSGFELSITSRTDGSLESAYIQTGRAQVNETVEVIKTVLLVDYAKSGALVGIEILAPVKISTVQSIATFLEVTRREPFRKFIKLSAPPALMLS